MGYLERLPCGCIVFGKDAEVTDEDRMEPVVVRVGCPIHDKWTRGVG